MKFQSDIDKLTKAQKQDLVSLNKHAGFAILKTLFESHYNILRDEAYRDITADAQSILRQGNRQGQGVMIGKINGWIDEARKKLDKVK